MGRFFYCHGSGWESNPPGPAQRRAPPILKTGGSTGNQPLPRFQTKAPAWLCRRLPVGLFSTAEQEPDGKPPFHQHENQEENDGNQGFHETLLVVIRSQHDAGTFYKERGGCQFNKKQRQLRRCLLLFTRLHVSGAPRHDHGLIEQPALATQGVDGEHRSVVDKPQGVSMVKCGGVQ